MGAFFDGIGDLFIDHVSSSKYWFITEPYTNENEIKEFENWISGKGVSLFYVEPGYHNDDVITTIIVPSNLPEFRARINSVLDTKTRYDNYINVGLYSFSFDKSYTRNVIRKYNPPSAYDCVRSAMNYLTWKDNKKGE